MKRAAGSGRAHKRHGRRVDILRRCLFAAALHQQACAGETMPTLADTGALPKGADSRVLRWVGAVEDSDVRVAALVGRGKARLFFCGGPKSYRSSTRWFDLAFNSEHLEFEDDTWHIHAHLLQGLSGEVERAGDRERAFTAGAFPEATLTGLYEGTAACGRIGLIVTQATEQDVPFAQGACTGTDGEPVQRVTLSQPIGSEKGKARVQTQSGEDALLKLAELNPIEHEIDVEHDHDG